MTKIGGICRDNGLLYLKKCIIELYIYEVVSMEASIVDLRYRMKDILEALERRETVKILYHGKVKGTIAPVSKTQTQKVASHPFFGMKATENKSVDEIMDELRSDRHDAL
jgi:antitoxin (DNA-binding transcriptional repressor) of toxin-antitoxin stability system